MSNVLHVYPVCNLAFLVTGSSLHCKAVQLFASAPVAGEKDSYITKHKHSFQRLLRTMEGMGTRFKKSRETKTFLGEQKITSILFPLVHLLILGEDSGPLTEKRKTNRAFSDSFEKPGKCKCLKCMVSFFTE